MMGSLKGIRVAVLVVFGAVVSAGCSVVPALSPRGRDVVASWSPPPSGCAPLGGVSGVSGDRYVGKFVDNDALRTGALNALRNETAARGGNYVHHTEQPHVYDHALEGTAAMAYTGMAYRCPADRLPRALVASR